MSIFFPYLGSVEHRAQVTVYCLLMGEKYQQPIDNGLLYYFKTNHMQQIPMPAQEKRAIMIKRNDIAHKLTMEKEKQALPDSLNVIYKTFTHNSFTCVLDFLWIFFIFYF